MKRPFRGELIITKIMQKELDKIKMSRYSLILQYFRDLEQSRDLPAKSLGWYYCDEGETADTYYFVQDPVTDAWTQRQITKIKTLNR